MRFIMNEKINEIPLIRQSVFTAHLKDIDNTKIVHDVNTYGRPVGCIGAGSGAVSRGFVQYEDIVMPVTPEITKLEMSIIGVLKQLTNRDYKISEMWAVKLENNQSIIAHSHDSNSHQHPEEYYSASYYPSAPDGSASLTFSSNWCGRMSGLTEIKVETGLLVVFNSFLTHMTGRQKINLPRMVVSFNLGPVEPNTNPNADWSCYWDRPAVDY